MHKLLREHYTQEDLNGLVARGQAKPFNMHGVGPVTAGLAEALNQEYAGMFDIKAVDNESFCFPIHLWARVDSKDGVPWALTVTYLLGDEDVDLTEQTLTELAREMGLATEKNWPSISFTRMHPLASYWPGKMVLQMHFLNMPPDKVIAFIKAVEDRLDLVVQS